MSKPLYTPVAGFFSPMPGWSSLTPIVSFPLRCALRQVGEAGSAKPRSTA